MTDATAKPASIHVTVSPCEEQPVDFGGYVSDRLAESYPGTKILVDEGLSQRVCCYMHESGRGSAADRTREGEIEEEIAEALPVWWEQLCNQPDHPAWGDWQ